jgi:hypothetical protein
MPSNYFTLDHHDYHWRRSAQDQNRAVFRELPPQQTEMQLLVICET